MFDATLKTLREKTGLTQGALADALGVAQSTVAGWETLQREPTHKKLCEIADYFGVTVDYLLGRSGADRRAGAAELDAGEKIRKLCAGLAKGNMCTINRTPITDEMRHCLICGLKLTLDAAIYRGTKQYGKTNI